MPQTQRIPRWPALALLAVLALQVTLVVGRSINWDEFYHYSLLHKLAAGTLSEPLQTAYTHLFQWVLTLPGTGIDHIIAIRWVMLGTELLTLAAIIGVASHFASRSAAWLCALSYAGAGYVFQHATSFRFDGPAAALLMSAAWLMLRPRLSPAVILGSGLMIGAAALLTIKVVLYAPVFAGIAWLRWQRGGGRGDLVRMLSVGIVSFTAFAIAYWFHAGALSSSADADTTARLGKVGGKMFSLGVQPYWPHHLKGAAIAPIVTLLVLAMPLQLWRAQRPLAEKVAITGLLAPLTTLFFYQNTSPYYFVFMLAPVCAALATGFDLALKRYSEALLAGILGACAVGFWAVEQPSQLTKQRQVQTAANALFPDHPAYFDTCAMLGTFPKANVFLTPLGISLYRQGAYPAMVDTMAEKVVPLVLNVDPLFDRILTTRDPVPDLFEQDLAALRDGYIQLWGPFWVAGRNISEPVDFILRVPGAYRVEGAALRIDGQLIEPGGVIELARGQHRAEPQAGPVRLIWAKAGRAPATTAPTAPWFTDF
jgi:hypothetical protein